MQTLPDGRLDLIQFFEVRAPLWEARAASIGLAPGVAAELAALTAGARAAWEAARVARLAAEAATFQSNLAVAALREKGAALTAVVKAFAASTGDPDVYSRANLSPPSKRRAPRPAPPAPVIEAVAIDASGEVHLRWRAGGTREQGGGAGPTTGVFFEVEAVREGGASLLGATAATHMRLPLARVAGGSVRVTAVRGDRRGEPSMLVGVLVDGTAGAGMKAARAA